MHHVRTEQEKNQVTHLNNLYVPENCCKVERRKSLVVGADIGSCVKKDLHRRVLFSTNLRHVGTHFHHFGVHIP